MKYKYNNNPIYYKQKNVKNNYTQLILILKNYIPIYFQLNEYLKNIPNIST